MIMPIPFFIKPGPAVVLGTGNMIVTNFGGPIGYKDSTSLGSYGDNSPPLIEVENVKGDVLEISSDETNGINTLVIDFGSNDRAVKAFDHLTSNKSTIQAGAGPTWSMSINSQWDPGSSTAISLTQSTTVRFENGNDGDFFTVVWG